MHKSDKDRARMLWKYFFPPEKYSLHEFCAKARYINHSAFVLCLCLTAFYGHTSNGDLSSMQTAKWGQNIAGVDIQRNLVTDLQVSPRHYPLSLGYTNTCGSRDSCAPYGQRKRQPDAVRYDAKDVGTQFTIVSGEAHLPNKAINPPPSIIEPREKATLLLEAANISLLNKKPCAISYNGQTERQMIRCQLITLNTGCRMESAYLGEAGIDQNASADRIHDTTDG